MASEKANPFTFNYPEGAVRGSQGYYLDGVWNWLPGWGPDDATDHPALANADWGPISTSDKAGLYQELLNLASPQVHRESEARQHNYDLIFSVLPDKPVLINSTADPYAIWLTQQLQLTIPSNQDGTPAVPAMPNPPGVS